MIRDAAESGGKKDRKKEKTQNKDRLDAVENFTLFIYL